MNDKLININFYFSNKWSKVKCIVHL